MQSKKYWDSLFSTLCRMLNDKRFNNFFELIQDSANEVGYKKVWKIVASCYHHECFGKIELKKIRF
ncbi:MAG: hypothetical protein HN334_02235 [Candidatus Cloacimonetes bacterium]|jgi:hypothetical protein|nr:hypothetical protein [Candidatus Cloacimonadota bacterium]